MNMGGPPSRDESFWGRSGGAIFKMPLQKFSISSLSWDLNFDWLSHYKAQYSSLKDDLAEEKRGGWGDTEVLIDRCCRRSF